MLRLLADENFNGRILRALQRQIPGLRVVQAQDTELRGADELLQVAVRLSKWVEASSESAD